MSDYRVVLIIPYDSEGRFLLQHRTKDARLLADHWAFFGGGINKGETLIQALKREAWEELELKVNNPRLVLEQPFCEGETNGYLYVYTEEFTGDKGSLVLNEGQGWGWFNENEVSALRMIERDRQIISRVAKNASENASIKQKA